MVCAAPQSLKAPPSLLTCCKSTSSASWAATGSLCSLRALSGTPHLPRKTPLNLVRLCNECPGTSGLSPPSGTAPKLLPLLPLALVLGLVLMMKATSGAPWRAVIHQTCWLPLIDLCMQIHVRAMNTLTHKPFSMCCFNESACTTHVNRLHDTVQLLVQL